MYQKKKDKKKWAKEYGIKFEMLRSIEMLWKKYYYKTLNIFKKPEQSRIQNFDMSINLLQALQKSHRHLTCIKLSPTFSKTKITGQISRDSILHNFYKKSMLQNKKYIYDKLTYINGSWEFQTVTII